MILVNNKAIRRQAVNAHRNISKTSAVSLIINNMKNL